jgi:hypothetical protein
MLNAVRQGNNLSIQANYAAVKQWLDIDDFIDYMIVNYYAGNTDWAHKNWYASFNRVDPNGRWRFHSWDAEHVFKSVGENVTGRIDMGGPTEIQHRLMGDASQGWIGSPEYRLRFADRMQQHFFNGGVLTPAAAGAVYAARMSEANRAIVGESARWGDNRREPAYTHADWLATQNNLHRSGSVVSQFTSLGWSVPIAAPLMSQYGGTVQPGYQLTLSLPPTLRGVPIYYTLDGSDPRDPATNLPRASALLYSDPITIDAQAQVKARIYVNDVGSSSVNEWSPIVEKEFFLPTPFPVRITELHYNPQSGPGGIQGEDLEFIELMNVGSQTINLAGVEIRQFAETPYTFASRFLGPGERIVVARNPQVFQTVYGTEVNLASTGYGPANLSNGGERIVLLGPLGETLQDFEYGDTAPWPSSPDGSGYSLHVIDVSGDASDPANWRASFYAGGSPGAPDWPIPGDYDGNGLVDGADAAAWRANYGLAVEIGTSADGNRDGVVNAADFVVWRKSMMAAPPMVASGASSVAIAAATSTEPARDYSTTSSDSLPTVNIGAARDGSDRSGFNAFQRAFGRTRNTQQGSANRHMDLLPAAAELRRPGYDDFRGASEASVLLGLEFRANAVGEPGEVVEPAATVWDDGAWLDGLFAARFV